MQKIICQSQLSKRNTNTKLLPKLRQVWSLSIHLRRSVISTPFYQYYNNYPFNVSDKYNSISRSYEFSSYHFLFEHSSVRHYEFETTRSTLLITVTVWLHHTDECKNKNKRVLAFNRRWKHRQTGELLSRKSRGIRTKDRRDYSRNLAQNPHNAKQSRRHSVSCAIATDYNRWAACIPVKKEQYWIQTFFGSQSFPQSYRGSFLIFSWKLSLLPRCSFPGGFSRTAM